jgi:hypothetical protein
MEPTSRHATTFVQRTRMRVLVEGQADEPLDVELRYDCADPYAVSLVLMGPDGPEVWAFARDLLVDGLSDSVGDGDVHVFSGGLADDSTVLIELVGDEVEVLLAADRYDVESFVAMTFGMVAPGHESEHLDVDAMIAAILAAEETND